MRPEELAEAGFYHDPVKSRPYEVVAIATNAMQQWLTAFETLGHMFPLW